MKNNSVAQVVKIRKGVTNAGMGAVIAVVIVGLVGLGAYAYYQINQEKSKKSEISAESSLANLENALTGRPASPTNFNAVIAQGGVQLTWRDVSNKVQERNFRIDRRIDGTSTWVQISN